MIKKIAITGGFGFIASKLAEHFSQKGIKVILIEHPEAKRPKANTILEVLSYDITNNSIPYFKLLESCDAIYTLQHNIRS